MADERKYLEENYDGDAEQRDAQRAEDIENAKKMAQEVEEVQQRAKEIFDEEILDNTGITSEIFDKKMKASYEEDTFHEYLVDGATLICTQATLEPFVLEGEVEEICLSQGKTYQCIQEWLTIPEHIMDLNGHSYATVNDTIKGTNIFPFYCNCKVPVDRDEEKRLIIENLESCRKDGVCQYLMRLNEQWDNMLRTDGKSYMKKKVTDANGNIVEAEGITRTSVLFCKHGGLIIPLTSGQKILTRDDVIIQNEENVSGENGISKKALRALMELEILNDFSDKKGYLVIEDGKLIGIKPHLAGDGYVTVGFGDCLREGDLEFYLEPERASRISGYLSDKTSEYDKMKETVIPVDICFEKLIQDVTPLYEKAKNDFEVKGFILSQNQLDALCIIKYQCYTIGDKAFKEILGNCDREALYDDVLEKHGKNGNFEYRTNIEMNIFFGDGSDESYETEGGLSNIIVEPLEEYYEE